MKSVSKQNLEAVDGAGRPVLWFFGDKEAYFYNYSGFHFQSNI